MKIERDWCLGALFYSAVIALAAFVGCLEEPKSKPKVPDLATQQAQQVAEKLHGIWDWEKNIPARDSIYTLDISKAVQIQEPIVTTASNGDVFNETGTNYAKFCHEGTNFSLRLDLVLTETQTKTMLDRVHGDEWIVAAIISEVAKGPPPTGGEDPQFIARGECVELQPLKTAEGRRSSPSNETEPDAPFQ